MREGIYPISSPMPTSEESRFRDCLTSSDKTLITNLGSLYIPDYTYRIFVLLWSSPDLDMVKI